jgi:hypothetical protein
MAHYTAPAKRGLFRYWFERSVAPSGCTLALVRTAGFDPAVLSGREGRLVRRVGAGLEVRGEGRQPIPCAAMKKH